MNIKKTNVFTDIENKQKNNNNTKNKRTRKGERQEGQENFRT